MADEKDDSTATAKLDADTAPWDKALDRAAASVSSWAAAVDAKFAGVSASVAAKTKAVSDYVGKIKKAADDGGEWAGSIGSAAGGVIGGSLGGAIGTAVLGPIGTTIGTALGGYAGAALGENLAKSIDLDAIVESVGELAPAVKSQADEIADNWAGIKFTFDRAWKEIRALVKEADLGTILDGTLQEGLDKVVELAGKIGTKVEETVIQGIARGIDLVNSAFERFKEPVQTLLNAVQNLLVEFGLVDKGTAKLGDQFAELKNVGETLFFGLIKGVGYFVEAFLKAGSKFVTTFGDPILNVIQQVLDGFKGAIALAAEVAPVGGKELERAALALDTLQRKIDKGADKLKELSAGVLARDWDTTSKFLLDRVQRGLPDAKERNFQDDLDRKNASVVDAPKVQAPVPPAVADVSRRASALVAGSQEAVRAIIADQSRIANMPVEPAKRTAVAVEEAAKTAKESKTLLEKIEKKLPDPKKQDDDDEETI